MVLKNFMDDKKLNLNKPVLSVRRIRAAVPSWKDEANKTEYPLPTVTHPPHYKPELKSGPVRNPGVVPFLWEQIPGKPKDDQIYVTEKKSPIAPRLPPGRKLKDNHNSEKAQENHTQNVYIDLDENMKKLEGIQDEEKIESEGGDEAYMDALDKLSRTESSLLNCSISGLEEPEAKPSGTYLTDPQTRDFMIGRFLPAAKAMTSEKASEYAPRKQQPAVHEQPRQLKKVVNGDKRPQLRYGPSFALKYSQSHDNGDEESDDDSSEDGHLPYKVCGLLPRFFLKSSVGLLNPVNGMSARARVPMSPSSRTRTGSSSTTSCSGSENELSKSVPTAHAYQEDNNYLKGRDISVCARNYVNKTIPGFTEGANSSDGLLANWNDAREEDLEKTLHVDIVHKVESPILKSFLPTMEKPSNSHDEDSKKINPSKPIIQNEVKPSSRKQLPAPPLPKSPSDSWLCRTLPSMYTKNASSRSYVGTGVSPNNQCSNPKWETIVKTTTGHQHHLRYSEELMALSPIPEAQ